MSANGIKGSDPLHSPRTGESIILLPSSVYPDRGRLAVSGSGAGLYSRRVIAWGMGSCLTQELVARTLTIAVERRRPAIDLAASYGPWVPVRCHHVPRVAGRSRSDGEHESARELLGQCRGGKFFPHAETELVHHRRYRTREDATQEVFEWIEVFYNRVRRHSTLGYHSPAEFEKMTTGA